ncbi:MAG: signal peptidase II [Desulfobulbaceae bacterium]
MWYFVLALLVVVVDQFTKFWVVERFALHETVEVIPGFFNLTYLTNTGAAFGILAGQPTWWRQVFFVCVAVAALTAIVLLFRRLRAESRWYGPALALIAGGAVGNLIDRVRQGAVIDFFDFYVGTYHWPAFNIADSAITVGVAIIMMINLFCVQGNGDDAAKQ